MNWITPIADRTFSDVASGTDKGFLNYTDLNRIENNSKVLSDELFTLGYFPTSIEVKTNWIESDMPYLAELNRILSAVKMIKDYYFDLGLDLPADMQLLTFTDMNQIETLQDKIYDSIDILKENLEQTFYICGTFNSGQILL